MGFGLLLVGYFTATMMSLNSCGGVFAFIGYFLMIFGSKKLSQYNRSFLCLLYASLALLVVSSAIAVYDVSVLLFEHLIIPSQLISDRVYDILLKTRLFLEFAFTAILCFNIKSISKQTGAQKTVYSSIRNFVFYCIFFVLQCVVWVASSSNIVFLKTFSSSALLPVWVVIIKLVCWMLNVVMLFSCYSKICDANDTEMRQKPSRFEFINRRRAEKEKRIQAHIEEAEEYIKSRKGSQK